MSEEGKFPGRWVVHYKDGTTITENRQNDNHWYEIPKDGIKMVGVLLDPRVVEIDISEKMKKPKGTQKIRINFEIPEHILPGSSRYPNYWMMDRCAEIEVRRGKGGKSYPFMRITNIRNAKGECTCKEVYSSMQVVSYSTNIYSLGTTDKSVLHKAGVDMVKWRGEKGHGKN